MFFSRLCAIDYNENESSMDNDESNSAFETIAFFFLNITEERERILAIIVSKIQ